MYTIGRLAQRARISADCIRFYERQGLVAAANKTASGYRLYTDEALRQIIFIRHAQRCGLSLGDIAELLHMHDDGESSSRSVRNVLREKCLELQTRIECLLMMTDTMESVLSSPCSNGNVYMAATESPLVTALSERLGNCNVRSRTSCGPAKAAA